MKILCVIDMQNEFIDGALGTKEAGMIVDDVCGKIKSYDGEIVFTRDTHGESYLQTQEGKALAVKHCIVNTNGWDLNEKIKRYAANCVIVDKPTFGSSELPNAISDLAGGFPIEEIELCGLCTDICIISNALILKAFFGEVPIVVDSKLCAGVTVKSHENALEAMKMCQIIVK
ncbi:MAG: isochorismatase family protein [Oscillospiraceae bacterium]